MQTSADLLEVTNLAVNLPIGAYQWEQSRTQTIYLTLKLWGNFRSAAKSDDLNQAIDYDLLCSSLCMVLASNRFQLIEAVADFTAEWLHAQYPITGCEVQVNKPLAIKNAENIRFTLTSLK